MAIWNWNPTSLCTLLEDRGYDVDRRDATLAGGGGSLTARRDRGSRAHLLVIDAGGQFRAEIAVAGDESSQVTSVAQLPLRIVTRTERVTTVTGVLTDAVQLPAMIDALDRLPAADTGNPAATHMPGRAEW